MAQNGQPSTEQVPRFGDIKSNKYADTLIVLGSLYVYAPNKGAPIFFTIAYATSALFHLWQC